ncbi:MAG: DUF5788 family protein [Methanotrichaceae archaeon]|nr:DUF5788 family protein [Methanotrichaceae archaeon]
MADEKGSKNNEEDYLTEAERNKLLANLHRVLVWVGVKDPDIIHLDQGDIREELQKFNQTEKDLPPEVHIDMETVEMHHLIWRLINEKELSEAERFQIEELIDLLQKQEHRDEEILKAKRLTHQQAQQLYSETSGCIRALLDLKDLMKIKEQSDMKKEAAQRKVDDARNWNRFIDQLEKDRN